VELHLAKLEYMGRRIYWPQLLHLHALEELYISSAYFHLWKIDAPNLEPVWVIWFHADVRGLVDYSCKFFPKLRRLRLLSNLPRGRDITRQELETWKKAGLDVDIQPSQSILLDYNVSMNLNAVHLLLCSWFA
jgi:hypothetical protein